MEEIIFEELREMLHNLNMWCKSRWHLYRAKQSKNMVELLISMCHDEEETKWQYTRDKSEILCEISSGMYHCKNETPAPLTLTDAFHVPLGYRKFVEELLSERQKWPQGVLYSVAKGPDFKIAITVITELNFNDDPKGYLRGYMEYMRELQMKIHKDYNQFRQSHKEEIEKPSYNINF